MKRSIRILALLLALISVFSLLVACGGDGEKGSTNKELESIIPDGTEFDPELPKKDFQGHEFTFITQQSNDYGYHVKYLVYNEAEEGNLLNDAIKKRNDIIEEKYNVTIKHYDAVNLLNEVRTQVMGGVVEFDAILANARTMSTLAREGLLYDLKEIDTFNLDKPYWDQRANSDLEMGGKLYYTNCDLNVHTIGSAIFFNKKMIQDFELTSPYVYMENNQWTIDNWAILAKSISVDVDNDGNMTEMDKYSQLCGHGNDNYFITGAGIRFTEMDNTTNTLRVALMDNPDKLVSVYEKTKSVFSDSSVAYCISCSSVDAHGTSSKWEYLRTLFKQDLYLFDYSSDDCLVLYKDMESEFGIVPFPKYDSNQQTYNTIYPDDFNLFGIPNIVENEERTGAIIEDMNYYSSFILIPVWYDTILTRRYTRDYESEATLRYIKENRVYDIGLYYNLGQFKTDVLWADSRTINISREYDRRKNAIEADIKLIFRDFTSK